MDLSGKTFLVTGGSSGLGAAVVREFAGAGANLVICDVKEPREAAAGEIASRVRFQKTDVGNEAQVQAAVDKAVEEFGALNGAVNCAGIATAERAVGREGAQPLDHFTKV